MQGIRVFFLAFLAVSAFSNTEATTLGFRNEKNINNAFDIFKQIIEESIHNYEDILKDIIGEANKNIQDELEKAFEEIASIVSDVIKVLEFLQSQKQIVKDCIHEFLPEIKRLITTTQETQTACVQESAEKILAIKNQLEADLTAEHEKVKQIVAAIQGCSNRDCYKENGTKLIELVGEVKGTVRDAIKEAVEVIQSSSPAALECIKGASDNFKAEIKNIHGKVLVCIKGSSM